MGLISDLHRRGFVEKKIYAAHIYHLRWEDNRNDLRKTSLHLYGFGFILLYAVLYSYHLLYC